MGIGLPLPGARELARSAAVVTPFLGHVEMDVYPFTFDRIKERPKLGGGDVDVVFIYLSTRADKFMNPIYDNIGLLGGGRETYRGKHHSWRRLKISPVGATIHIDVNIQFYEDSDGDDRESQLNTYVEWIHDLEGQATLGGLADMLDAISHRTLNEHRVFQTFMINQGKGDLHIALHGSHKIVMGFLQSATMHLAWMQFEYGLAMKRLKSKLDQEPSCYHKSATARLDNRLANNNNAKLRHLYFCREDTDSNLRSDAWNDVSVAESHEVHDPPFDEEAEIFDDCIDTLKQDKGIKAIDKDHSIRPSTPETWVEETGTFWILNLSTNAQAAYTRADTAELYGPDTFDVLLVLLILLTLWALYTMLSLLVFVKGWKR